MPRTARGSWRQRVGERSAALAFLLPALVVVLAVSLYPIARTFYLSLTDESLSLPTSSFIGSRNFTFLFGNDLFWQAWRQTLNFTAMSVAAETVVGLAIALVLYEPFRGRGIVRAVILIPWAIPTVVTSRMFQFMFDGQVGVVNYLLRRLHLISENVGFLSSPGTAMATMVIADVWKTAPFMALLILAGLHSVPSDVLEAARVDGASVWRTLWSVRLPIVAPFIVVAAMFRALDAWRIFDLPYVLTGGGPADSTETLSTIAYKQMFSATQVGMGSAISVAMFVCEIAIAACFAILLRSRYRKLEGASR